MSTKLKQYFPMPWEKDKLLETITASSHLHSIFSKWTTEQREEFINFAPVYVVSNFSMTAFSRSF